MDRSIDRSIRFFSMERGIPHRDTPGTFLFINFNSKYFNFIPNNAISFQIILCHSKKYFFIHVFKGFFEMMISRFVVLFGNFDLFLFLFFYFFLFFLCFLNVFFCVCLICFLICLFCFFFNYFLLIVWILFDFCCIFLMFLICCFFILFFIFSNFSFMFFSLFFE